MSDIIKRSGNTDVAIYTVSDKTRKYLEESLAPSTRRAYESDWRIFVAWCLLHDHKSLPALPTTIADFISDQAGGTYSFYEDGQLQHGNKIAPPTLIRRIAAIRYIHRAAGFDPSPTDTAIVKSTIKGVRRTEIHVPTQKKAATNDIVSLLMSGLTGHSLKDKRDRALLLIGFAGAFRRSELVSFDTNDIEYVRRGIILTVRKSKTDQEGQGHQVAIIPGRTHCPITALEDWLDSAMIAEGPIFRRMHKTGRVTRHRLTDQSVALIIKRHALAAGLDPEIFAGHSLRRGFITSAADANVQLPKIMEVSRHKSMDTLRRYIEQSRIFDNHAGDGLL